MIEAFKRLNLRNEALMQENAKLRERLQKMESKGGLSWGWDCTCLCIERDSSWGNGCNTRQDVQTQTDI